MLYEIQCSWDPEAGVWIATSNDIPGLVLESESFDTLIGRARTAAGELILLNGLKTENARLRYHTVREDAVMAHG